jgi:hypothetical protein
MRFLRSLPAIATILIAGSAGAPASADTSPPPGDAQAIYASALHAMNQLEQPAYVTYRLESSSEGLAVNLVSNSDGVWLGIHGGTEPSRWSLQHRTFDYQSVITEETGRVLMTRRSFFDPTWYGAVRALREGMLNSQDDAAPRELPGPASPGAPLKTIGVTAAMGPGVYTVRDLGPAACPSGSAGHELGFTRRDANALHQLSHAIVETSSQRFCMLRFATAGAFGFHGFVEQHYADVGGYWMQTDGLLDGNLRMFAIAGKHGVWRYRLLDMQFPSTMPGLLPPVQKAAP